MMFDEQNPTNESGFKDFAKAGEIDKTKKGRTVGSSKYDKLTLAEMKARISGYWKEGKGHDEICQRINDEYALTDEMKIKPSTVHYHIKMMLKYWKEMGLLNVDEKMALTLAKLDMYEQIATEALFRSFDDKETVYYEKQLERAHSKDRESWIREEIAEQRERIIAERESNRPNSINGAGSGRGNKIKPIAEIIHDISGPTVGLEDIGEKIKQWKRQESGAGDPRWLVILIDINDKRAKLWKLYAKDDASNPDQELARLSDDARDARIAAVLTAALRRKNTDEKGALAPAGPMGGFEEKDIPNEAKRMQLAPHRPLQADEEILITPIEHKPATAIEFDWDDDWS